MNKEVPNEVALLVEATLADYERARELAKLDLLFAISEHRRRVTEATRTRDGRLASAVEQCGFWGAQSAIAALARMTQPYLARRLRALKRGQK